MQGARQWKKLKVNVSNKYLISFGVLKCMLILVRMDFGTENVKVATVQYAFPARHSYRVAVERSFMYGTSPANVVCVMKEVVYQYIKILLVRPSVCVCVSDGCGRGRNEFAVRVQNHYVRFSFDRNGHYLLEIVKAAAGLDTLRCRLREGCHCGRLPLHWRQARTQNYLACWTRTRTDFSFTCYSVQGARQPLSSRAISLGSFTDVQYGGRGQEVTFEPTSNAHARVDYMVVIVVFSLH